MMRGIAGNAAARGLLDDAAVITLGQETLILTHDVMVAGVHWLPHADPADVAWKLTASNLSDLAAKGAEPLGLLLGYMLAADSAWDARFAEGLDDAIRFFGVSLWGGDTVAGGKVASALGMTAIGRATSAIVPARGGARAGDLLYVTGNIGDAKAGFDLETIRSAEAPSLRRAFNRPLPRLAEGRLLAPVVHAMMDISDGLLLDAKRMADASGLQVIVNVDAIPISADYARLYGDDIASKMAGANWGDDYQLLFALPPGIISPVDASRIGQFTQGEGLKLYAAGKSLPNPPKLGFEHQ